MKKNKLLFHKAIFTLSTLFTLFTGSSFAQDSATRYVVSTKAGPVNVERLASLSEPWGMAFLPDGRLLVTEKPGRLRIYTDGKLSEPITGLPVINYFEQGGLLDVEVDPAFAQNGFVYFYYVEAAPDQPNVKSDNADKRLGPYQKLDDFTLKGGAVARARLVGASLQDVTVIWRQSPKQIGRGHYGGRIVFSPDGKLFITSGDRQRFEPAQDRSGNLGKIVRINADGSLPKDNPVMFRNAKTDVWSMGHRNPLGAAINPATQKLWIHEMGPKHGDEFNMPEPGKNYGWPAVSNGDHYDGSKIPDHDTRAEFAKPVFYWHPAISPSGLIFYTGTMFPQWKGNALLGGLSSEVLLSLTFKDNAVASEERVSINKRIRDVIQAPDGSIWLLTDYKNGELLRISPAGR